MKQILIVFMLFAMTFISGCLDPKDTHTNKIVEQKLKYAHEETMAEIKAEGERMSDKDKEQLADMIADRVVERLKQEQK